MSGVEVLGVATAVLQIADLGGKVSVRLFGFARKVKGAAEKIDLISKDIAATGALLHQLGQQLNRDGQAQLLRPELIQSANDLVFKCKEIFRNIDGAIDGNSGNKIILSLKQKFHYAYLESEIDMLRVNLENLKGSIGIMQNILIYAEQLRNREQFPVLKEQRDLLEALGQERVVNEQRHINLMMAIKDRPDKKATTPPSPKLVADQSPDVYGVAESSSTSSQPKVKDIHTNSPSSLSPPRSNTQLALNDHELREYSSLMAYMLAEIHSNRYNLERKMRSRLHDGVLDIHWREWAPFRQAYRDDVLLKKFNHLPELHHFWVSKIERQRVLRQQQQRRRRSVNNRMPLQADHLLVQDFISKPQHSAKDEPALLRPEIEKTTEPRAAMQRTMGKQQLHPLRPQLFETEMEVNRDSEGADSTNSEPLKNKLVGRDSTGFLARARPEYTKVKRSHLSENTLNFYELPWVIDTTDPGYLLIKGYVNRELMEELFRITRERRAQAAKWEDEEKLPASSTIPEDPSRMESVSTYCLSPEPQLDSFTPSPGPISTDSDAAYSKPTISVNRIQNTPITGQHTMSMASLGTRISFPKTDDVHQPQPYHLARPGFPSFAAEQGLHLEKEADHPETSDQAKPRHKAEPFKRTRRRWTRPSYHAVERLRSSANYSTPSVPVESRKRKATPPSNLEIGPSPSAQAGAASWTGISFDETKHSYQPGHDGLEMDVDVPPPRISFDIPSLLTQWTTLTPQEIALGAYGCRRQVCSFWPFLFRLTGTGSKLIY